MVKENLIKGSLTKERLVKGSLTKERLVKRGLTKERSAKGSLGNWRKGLVFAALTGFWVSMSACSGKETVLLEADDLVRIEGRMEVGEGAFDAMEEEGERVEESTLFVHICGEVERPGVYELPRGSRIYEAVEEAGGFTAEAAEDYVNLAYVLEDGWKIEIPARESLPAEDGEGMEEKAGGILTGAEGAASSGKGADRPAVSAGIAADAAAVSVTAAGMAGRSAEDGLVDINTATKEELLTLPGVGESRAESIISYREKNGGFSRIEDIMKVDGIKEGMFGKMKDKICVRGER